MIMMMPQSLESLRGPSIARLLERRENSLRRVSTDHNLPPASSSQSKRGMMEPGRRNIVGGTDFVVKEHEGATE